MTLKKLTLFLAVHYYHITPEWLLSYSNTTVLWYQISEQTFQFIFGSLFFFFFFGRLRFIYALFPISTNQLLQKQQQNQTPKSFSEIHLTPTSTSCIIWLVSGGRHELVYHDILFWFTWTENTAWQKQKTKSKTQPNKQLWDILMLIYSYRAQALSVYANFH